jgi:hypothetical protein
MQPCGLGSKIDNPVQISQKVVVGAPLPVGLRWRGYWTEIRGVVFRGCNEWAFDCAGL